MEPALTAEAGVSAGLRGQDCCTTAPHSAPASGLLPQQPEAASLPVHFLHPTGRQSPSCCAHKPLSWPPGSLRGPATKVQNIMKGFLGQSTTSHKQPSDPTEVADPSRDTPLPRHTQHRELCTPLLLRGIMSANCGTRRLTRPPSSLSSQAVLWLLKVT